MDSDKIQSRQQQVSHTKRPVPTAYGKVIKRSTTADSILAVGGLAAVTLGVLLIFSAARSEPNQRHSISGGGFLLFSSDETKTAIIIFGLATAIAWNLAGRAVFRIVAFESAPVLSGGVRQHSLSDIFELKFPTRNWLKWRAILWKSTVFGTFCSLLYGVTALAYRFALTDRNLSYTEHEGPELRAYEPFMGCSSGASSIVEFDKIARSPKRFMFQFSQSRASLGDSDSDKWIYRHGWTASENLDDYFYADSVEVERRGPVLVSMSKSTTLAISNNSSSGWIVLPSEDCGPLLGRCEASFCDFVGLSFGNFTMHWPTPPMGSNNVVNPYRERDIGYIDESPLGEPRKCPLRVNSSLYDQVIKDIQGCNYFDELFVAQNLISRLGQNPAMFLDERDTKALRDYAMLYPEECSSQLRSGLYSGHSTFFYYRQFNPTPLYIATACLVTWGVLLMLVSLPSNRLLITGTLDQWMSFGADLGKESMTGSSSGRHSAVSEDLWQLQTAVDQRNKTARLEFHGANNAAHTTSTSETERLKYGFLYI